MNFKDSTYQENFRIYLNTLGYQSRSVRTQIRLLHYFLNRIYPKTIENITTKDIADYYEYLETKPNKRTGGQLNQKTIAHYKRNIVLFFDYLEQTDLIQTNPLHQIYITKQSSPKTITTYIRNILSQQEVKTLYKHTKNALERLVLSLGYGCGLRVSELVQLNIVDINLEDKIVIIPSGKGNKRRIVPMSKGVCKDIIFYLKHERDLKINDNYPSTQSVRAESRTKSPLVLDSKGNRMQQWTYNKILKQIINRTNDIHIINKNITIHSLRHSIATHLLEQGLSLEQVKQFLGHAYLQTTEIYTHIIKIKLKEDDTNNVFTTKLQPNIYL
jgi:integrase/recombinase XerD